MHCLNCGFDSPADARFCVACGTPLPRLCGACGEVNPARFKFCGACGSPLAGEGAGAVPEGAGPPPRTPAPAEETRVSIDPERRHLTVMFCDLVGSTALSLTLDPEELREVVRSYQAASASVIEQFGGYIAQYLGDGLLVYFGFPVALEDEADRAVGAGLGIVAAIDALNQRLKLTHGVELGVRIGVHTGVVVVGEVGGGARREHLALGDTPNIAARLQSLATPNVVVLSSDTYRLVARTFECEEMGAHAIKGVPNPEPIYRVLRERRMTGPEPGRADGRLTSLLGREHELKLLLDRWARVIEGEGRVACISGDPGIGKTHLVHELKLRAGVQPRAQLDARCLPYYRNTAFHPFIDLLEAELDARAAAPGADRLDTLAALLRSDDMRMAESLPLFASLLSVRRDGSPARPPLHKEKTRAALVELLLRMASNEPVILTIEDLHWADASTLEVLDQLMPQVAGSRLFILFTFRPEFGVRWASHAHVTHLYLGRLRQQQAEALVSEVAQGRTLPAELVAQIVARTDGVPLFVEELTKMLLESGLLEERGDHYALRGPLPPLAIPTTLRDSLEARLDRLSAVKEIAQLGATIGREFTYAVARAVSSAAEEALTAALAELVDVGLLYVRGAPPDATYVFKHALIQEAAYQSLLRSTRQRHHQRIAAVLEELFPETAATEPEVLAHHYTAAGLNAQAIQAWRHAGQRALERSANAEAVGHLTQALELVAALPQSDERSSLELDLLCMQAPALAATRGYIAGVVRDTYLRARELCVSAGRDDALAQVLVGLFAYHFVRAELGLAAGVARELSALARASADPVVSLAADAVIGVSSLAGGELASANEHLERVIRNYDPDRHAAFAISYGQDFGVVGLAYSALLHWIIGCPDRARQRAQEALDLAERLQHPHSIALALSLGGSVHHFTRDAATVRAWAGRLLELSLEQGFGHWAGDAKFLLAWAMAEDGRLEEALITMEAEIAAFRGFDTIMPYQYHYRSVAELHARLGRPAHGITILDGLERMITDASEGWWWESEVHRLRAELSLMVDPHDEQAEAGLLHALETARLRRARSLELRAVLGLARLWRDRGRAAEARALLADCTEGFTEGFDTADFVETRALLEELDAAVTV